MQAPPVYKDLVLIGGGHAHVAVLKMFGMRPLPGVRLTLVSRTIETPYSGMLPGLVAGHYSHAEAHIDLAPLCRFAGARLIRAEAIGLDPEQRLVQLAGRPPLGFDVASINTGSTPALPPGIEPGPALTPVKPVDLFLRDWTRILSEATDKTDIYRIAVVGGGAGGVELALALRARCDAAGLGVQIELLTADRSILPTHNTSARRRLGRALARHGIPCRTSTRVVAANAATLGLETGERLGFDHVIWVTQAAAPPWLGSSGLALDPDGFLLVDSCLRSLTAPTIFGAGDVVAIRGEPRPKSGVFAVRQGRPLAANLRNALLGQPLRRYRPQRAFLSLIGTGDGSAVASRGRWSFEGRAVWRWKESIDRRFMRQYQQLPAMRIAAAPDAPSVPRAIAAAAEPQTAGDSLRCGGCGAKVGAEILEAALHNLTTGARPDVAVGLGRPDDAALLRPDPRRLIALSVDAFRPMLDDPWLFGRITANHCLNDLFAIGAEPQAALAIVGLPDWPAAKQIDELRQMLSGAATVLIAHGAELVGGHTSESAEVSLGFSVTGLVDERAVLSKTGLVPGDALILTKPLGTGAILAANMRGAARGRWLESAIAAMCKSNAAAAPILARHGTHACTDVTGFGLFGHLLEMARDAAFRIELDLNSLPLIEGAIDCVRAGVRSTLQPANEKLQRRADLSAALTAHAAFPVLFDPQTAGGLLAAVPAATAAACIGELAAAGLGASCVIGHVGDRGISTRISVDLAPAVGRC